MEPPRTLHIRLFLLTIRPLDYSKGGQPNEYSIITRRLTGKYWDGETAIGIP